MFALDKKITLDNFQLKIQKKLQKTAELLENKNDEGFFNKFFSNKTAIESLYIYGSAGCGKTTLMQEFYNSLQKTSKIYFHFNAFMHLFHKTLRDIRSEEKNYKDELIEAIKRIIDDKKLLCFDEFQVLDIADAMILGRIFTYLFSKKIVIIFTSNSAPQDLYKKGLQRELFLDFINNILLKNCEIISLENSTDYRSIYRKNLAKRYFVSNALNRLKIKEIIANFTESNPLEPRILKVWGRDLKIKHSYKKIAVINFDDICRTELSASDYRAICQEFDLIFLLKLPILLKSQNRNEIRRFMLFIDEVYENKAALIVLAKTKIDKIYDSANSDFSFARTISRLKEIKSDEYWAASKLLSNN